MITILSFVLSLVTSAESNAVAPINEYLGQWSYTVEAPDMTYKGILDLSNGTDGIEGKMMSQGVTLPLQDVVLDGDELTFTVNVQGYVCKVKGTFSDDSFKGTVAVDGFEMIMIASREE